MKKLIFISLIMIFSVSIINAQMREKPNKERKSLAKIEQLEKAKIIETLDLNEDTAVRFFSRKNEHKKKMREIFLERENIIEEIDNVIKNKEGNDSYFKGSIVKLTDIDNKIQKEREAYNNSLKSILTNEQIAKLAVFEFKFRRELASTLTGRKPEEGR